MVDWSNLGEVNKDADIFHKLVFALFGIYVWELSVTWDFEWSLITNRRKFRWPLGTHPFVPSDLACLLKRVLQRSSFVAVIVCCLRLWVCRSFFSLGLRTRITRGLLSQRIISFSITTEINCQALVTFNSWTGNMSILCASTSLMLRTVALWDRRKTVIATLGILCLAHWTLLYRTMFIVVSQWDPEMNACVVVQANPSMLNTTFFFTMGFDFVILVFTAFALLSRHSARTGLWKLLFQDGLVYFIISFSTNCIPAVLNVLNLNTPMNVMGTIPAATITSIAACRAVMRLLDFNSSDVYVHSISAAMSSSNPPAVRGPTAKIKRAEVRVVTEHITMAEFPYVRLPFWDTHVSQQVTHRTSRACSPYMKTEKLQGSTSTDIKSGRDLEALSDQGDKNSMKFSDI